MNNLHLHIEYASMCHDIFFLITKKKTSYFVINHRFFYSKAQFYQCFDKRQSQCHSYSLVYYTCTDCRMMATDMRIEEYQTLTRAQKVKKVLPKVLPVLVLSVILPTADVESDLALITKLYTGLAVCVDSSLVGKDEEEWRNCEAQGADLYCTPEVLSKKNNTVCGLSNSSHHFYVCRDYKIWSTELKDNNRCKAEGAEQYCSDPASNQNVCGGRHPNLASSLLFFFTLNYTMGLVTCLRLEGRKWIPLITALFNVYPQYGK